MGRRVVVRRKSKDLAQNAPRKGGGKSETARRFIAETERAQRKANDKSAGETPALLRNFLPVVTIPGDERLECVPMGKVYAGASGWAYGSWKPDFYPAKLSVARFLNHYASRLNSVEVNYTFGRRVNVELLERWAAAAPDHFRFAVKAHRRITHSKRLRDAAPVTAEFLAALEPLRRTEKLGPVLFQLPGNFKCDVGRLREFLTGLPPWVRAAFEFRHESWFSEDVYATLRKAGAALCLAEGEELATPEVVTADFHYLRLRKESYSRRSVAAKVHRLAQNGDVFVYFKHEDTPEGALRAEALLRPARKK